MNELVIVCSPMSTAIYKLLVYSHSVTLTQLRDFRCRYSVVRLRSLGGGVMINHERS